MRRDRQRRALPVWQTCRRLAGDELLRLSSTSPKSLDSRYFGTASVDGMIVRVQLF
ncbi:S26 family signal peptidase [Pseudomonas aeruginosa]|uniref:S26 family signal peptidase n=1 Tax=Pseudomonas aeruginosa TaxID=287 RepID=UPI00301A5B30